MIYIDMQMPKNCAECPCYGLNEFEHSRCNITGNEFPHNIFDGKAKDCPLKDQEAVKPIPYHRSDGTIFKYECRKCRTKIFKIDSFCRRCGQEVKWK